MNDWRARNSWPYVPSSGMQRFLIWLSSCLRRIGIQMLRFFGLWHGGWYVNPVKNGRRHQGVLWWQCPRNNISITRGVRTSGIFEDSLFCTSSAYLLASEVGR